MRLLFPVLLLAAVPLAWAESPLPDPVAPAVIGRPLDEIRPARAKSGKPTRPKQASARTAPAMAAAIPAVAPAAAPPAQPQHAAKQALDDRADPRARLPDNVGKGTRVASKPLAPGAYLGSKAQAVVRKYYAAHPAPGQGAANWRIGEPMPKKAQLTGVPDSLRAALPRVPPGHQYVQVDGEVVLVAVQSRMVVDGVSRAVR